MLRFHGIGNDKGGHGTVRGFSKYAFSRALGIAGAFALALLAAGHPASAESRPGTPENRDVYSGIFPDVVAKVDAKPVYGRELERAIRSELMPIGSPKWTDLREDYRGRLVYSSLSSLINQKLLYAEAVAAGVTTSDEEVQDAYLKMTQQFKDEGEMQAYLDRMLIDREGAVEDLQKNLLLSKCIDTNVRRRVTVTPEEMSRYYEEHQNEFRHPDIVRTSQIFLESDGTPEGEAKAEQLARELFERIQKGEDFAELARQHSKSSTAEQGGDIGYTSRDVLAPEYAEAAFSLPIGESKVVKMAQGYRILKVTDRKKEGISSLKDAEDSLREFLMNEKAQAELVALVNRLRDQAEIEYLIPAGAPLTP